METILIFIAFLSVGLLLGGAIGLGFVVWFFGDSGRRSRPATPGQCGSRR